MGYMGISLNPSCWEDSKGHNDLSGMDHVGCAWNLGSLMRAGGRGLANACNPKPLNPSNLNALSLQNEKRQVKVQCLWRTNSLHVSC